MITLISELVLPICICSNLLTLRTKFPKLSIIPIKMNVKRYN